MTRNSDHDITPPSLFSLPRSRTDRRSKPFDWLTTIHHAARGEARLWLSVIIQAMVDAASKSGGSEAGYDRYKAQCWLTGDSADFVMVCTLTGYDPDWLRGKIKNALGSPRAWRKAAGGGDGYLSRKRKRNKNGGGGSGGGIASLPGSPA